MPAQGKSHRGVERGHGEVIGNVAAALGRAVECHRRIGAWDVSAIPRRSSAEPMEAGEETRLLIVTGAAVADPEELPALVRSLIESASEILVVTPVLPGRLQWLVSDTDRVRHEADERLRTVMGHVETLAPEAAAAGGVGDETPLSAFADAVRRFRPDHILLALRASDHSAWQERGLTERVREAFHIPLTLFEIDRSGRVPAPGSSTDT